jgi:hypothetical protein
MSSIPAKDDPPPVIEVAADPGAAERRSDMAIAPTTNIRASVLRGFIGASCMLDSASLRY